MMPGHSMGILCFRELLHEAAKQLGLDHAPQAIFFNIRASQVGPETIYRLGTFIY